MKYILRILHLEDNPTDAELIRSVLDSNGINSDIHRVQTKEDFTYALDNNGFDLILSDYSLPSFDGLSALSIARTKAPDIPFIFVSGTMGEESAIESLINGASDYVLKHNMKRLIPAVKRALHEANERKQRKEMESQVLRMQRMESIGTLAGGIAHDLNNVLSPIMLALEILSRKLPDEQSQKMLQMILANARRGAELIKQVLSFVRGVVGEHSIVQVRHLIDEMGKTIKETFPKSMYLMTDVPKNLPTISADATQIHQVLMNLCVNARDAMPDGGIIEIKGESIVLDEQYVHMHVGAKPGKFVVITVTDQGTGIPPANLERIFEPFFTTKEIGKGTGLGLSTVLAIIKSHNGFVNVYSEVGKGTTFKVYVPAQEGEQAIESEEKENLPLGNGELILVVDDEQGIREITKATLEAHGYAVILASDGTEAVSAYATFHDQIALVVTDMLMPFMDGTATIRALQKMNPKVKILAVSGLKQNEYNVNQETVEFLHKPYTSEKLLKAIKEMLTKW